MTKLSVVAVGRPRGAVAESIGDFETRVKRYFAFTTVEVKEEAYRGAGDATRVREEEGVRLLARVPHGASLVALHETGESWTSVRLAEWIADLGHTGASASFVIGGAYGLSDDLLGRARLRLSLSRMTLTHEIARLVLTEQLYRAGSIARGEPYHKGRDA